MRPSLHTKSEHVVERCSHCGDVCAGNAVRGEDTIFCCSGCRSVYELLQQSGMCAYYSVSDAAGVSQRTQSSDAGRFEVLNDPATAARFIEYASGNNVRVRFVIPSMHCASCVWLLEQLRRFDDGIQWSRVDFMRKTVTLEFDKEQTSVPRVAKLLSAIGYEPLLVSETSNTEEVERRRFANRAIHRRIGVAAFAAGNVMMMSIAQYLAGPSGMDKQLVVVFSAISVLISIPVFIYSASPWLLSALGSLRRGVVNLDIPVALGITTLFVRSLADIFLGYGEGFLDSFAGLVLFLLVGRLFQQRAFDTVSFDRTVRSFFPLSVRRIERGQESVIPIDAIVGGDALLVRNGEVIPTDSVLVSNTGYIDYSFVTGESTPVECTAGALVHAGGKVVGRPLQLTAMKKASHSYLASLWERTVNQSPRNSYLHMKDRFGLWFTVGTLAIAIAGAVAHIADPRLAINVFTGVLIIACPCALTLAAPITLGSAMGFLGTLGIYIKNVGVLTELRRVRAVVFDKTGTLTIRDTSNYSGTPLTQQETTAIRLLAACSTHPASQAIANGIEIDTTVDVIEEVPGAGLRGHVLGLSIVIGSSSYVRLHARNVPVTDGTIVAIGGEYVGVYTNTSVFRRGVAQAIQQLRDNRYTVAVFSGDNERDEQLLATTFMTDEVRYHMTPEEKVDAVEETKRCGPVLMVGDGLNDMSAMAAASVSIAVTNDTSMLAPASDVVMYAQDVALVPVLLRYAKWCSRVISFALWFTMAYNVLAISIALTGKLTPVVTAILMPLSSLLVVGISVGGARLYRWRTSWA